MRNELLLSQHFTDVFPYLSFSQLGFSIFLSLSLYLVASNGQILLFGEMLKSPSLWRSSL